MQSTVQRTVHCVVHMGTVLKQDREPSHARVTRDGAELTVRRVSVVVGVGGVAVVVVGSVAVVVVVARPGSQLFYLAQSLNSIQFNFNFQSWCVSIRLAQILHPVRTLRTSRRGTNA